MISLFTFMDKITHNFLNWSIISVERLWNINHLWGIFWDIKVHVLQKKV